MEEQRRQQEALARQQQQQQQQYNPSPPSVRKDDMLSLDDMIRSKIDPSSLSVRTLKSILKANFVEQSHVLEKSDLISRVERLATQRKKELADKEGGNTTTSDDSLCRICLDAEQNCVFLDCGHMVACMDCAKQLLSSKNECPICREAILKLVHVFRS
ncbi:zinc finger, C3HC4 type-domain-containing protein [Circinella umbellata]|nr:zinc finger, C3HC4 type-domain-containing protein [Circinella umbellata]